MEIKVVCIKETPDKQLSDEKTCSVNSYEVGGFSYKEGDIYI